MDNSTNLVVKILLSAAVNLELLDAHELVEHIANGDAPESIVQAVDSYADALQHTDLGKRRAWFRAREAVFWFTLPVAHERKDKHGFRDELRNQQREALFRVGVEGCLVNELQEDGLKCGDAPALEL